MERRVEKSHSDRHAVHHPENLLEVDLLNAAQFFERFTLLVGVTRQDHAPHDRQSISCQKHVLGPAEPDAFRAQLSSLRGIRAVVGVRPNRHVAGTDCVSPAQDREELFGGCSCCRRPFTDDHITAGAVDRDDVAHGDRDVADRERTIGDLDCFGADDCRRAPAAGDDCGVADEPTLGRQEACGDHHSVHISRRRLVSNQDH